MRVAKVFISIFLLFLFFSCKGKTDAFSSDELLAHYEKENNPEKIEALLFILESIKKQNTEIPVFVDRDSHKITPVDFDKFTDKKQIMEYVQRNYLEVAFAVVSDTVILKNKDIIKTIDSSYDAWKHQKNEIPKHIYMEYLLPYKIFFEKYADWREIYSKEISKLNIESDSIDWDENGIYYKIVDELIAPNYSYTSTPFKLSKLSGYDELNVIREYDCYGGSYLGVYALRAAGIPATVDIVPLWGSRNSGHASEVFWDSKNSCFSAAKGRELGDRFPAKVFRLSYKCHDLWDDSIKHITDGYDFLISELKNNYWLDVTGEHTPVSDVACKFEDGKNSGYPFYYICVYNYGEWLPIYFGINTGGETCFKNMGRNVLYRIAIPSKTGYELISDILYLDNNGSINSFTPGLIENTVTVQKINHGDESWVKSGKRYSLYYWDYGREWVKCGENICKRDSIMSFDNVPFGTCYKLIDHNSARRLERIFTYENREQVWM